MTESLLFPMEVPQISGGDSGWIAALPVSQEVGKWESGKTLSETQ